MTPKLSPLQDCEQSAERLREFQLAGTFLALYIMVLRHPVAGISPHVMFCLLCGSCPPDLEYLHAVDPNAASILTPWFDFIESARSTQSAVQPITPAIRHLLAEYLAEPVR
jgi:hypothetical protein